MPMEVGGILGELFSFLFFIISFFLMILIELLCYKFFKVNIISYYKFFFLIIKLLIINYEITSSTIGSTPIRPKTDNQSLLQFFVHTGF